MYTGRFAPSPTGPLHFGSLVAALASFLRARQQNGRWLLRIEDIDPPREPAGAGDQIIRTLAAHGLEWDGPVSYQSRHGARYEKAIAEMTRAGTTYPCTCSRKQIRDAGAIERVPGLGPVYPGNCRLRPAEPGREAALRVRVGQQVIEFRDRLQGTVRQALAIESGDFVIRRRDGLYAYSLAVAVDDAIQQVTEVVRGIDLLTQTPRQIYIMQLLDYPIPAYAHVPIATTPQGQKLSKQNRARPLDNHQAGLNLARALQFLGLPVEPGLAESPCNRILDWGLASFQLDALAGTREKPVDF